MPELQNNLALETQVKKKRKNYTRQHHFSYLAAKELGLNEDIRKKAIML
jgi:hypothetical protein